jgi:uncharacterized protein (DUF1501 family)
MLDPDISTGEALRHLHVAETDPFALDRRRFLQLIGMGLGAGALAGPGSSLLDSWSGRHDPSTWAAGPLPSNAGILVIIGMFGGNDGLNTVVPFNDPKYYEQHGGLAISGVSTLRLDANNGLHPNLTELKRFWDRGQLAIVQGIGYPNADLSHFNSMAKWMAGKPTGAPDSGWIGRWLDRLIGGGKELYAAVEVGHSLPLHLAGTVQRGTVVPAGKPAFGAGTDDSAKRLYKYIRSMNVDPPSTWKGRVGEAFKDQLDVAAKLAPIIPNELADGEMPARLEVMARLINANLGFRVFTAGWGDFDSHAGQPGMHPARMAELNSAIRTFYEHLDPRWSSQVTVMTFSEFGRTSFSNDGGGTDHGTSAPHFVFGANVKGGMYGLRPTLNGLARWDRMAHHVDMRDFYGSVLDGWMGGGGQEVLGRPIENLGLFRRGPGQNPPPSPSPGATGAAYTPLSPARIVDTREGVGAPKAPIGPGRFIDVQITGKGGVPAAGVKAVALNVTSVNATTNTNFRVYPAGSVVPEASALNPRPGRAVPNMVVVGLGTGGRVRVFNANGSADCIVDVMGYFGDTGSCRINPLVPARLLDTRDGTGAPKARLRGGSVIELQVTGRGGVPASDVSAVVLNLGSVAPTARGFLTMWPTGERRPEISNLNYVPGMNIPNLVMCKVGRGGKVSLYASSGVLDVIADVVGCYCTTGARLVSIPPSRLLDTRQGLGAPQRKVGGPGEIVVQVGGKSGVPAAAKAVVVNVTAVGAGANTFVTVYPDGASRPTASSLNVTAGHTASNLVLAKLGAGGRIRMFNKAGSIDLVADVTGYFV